MLSAEPNTWSPRGGFGCNLLQKHHNSLIHGPVECNIQKIEFKNQRTSVPISLGGGRAQKANWDKVPNSGLFFF